MVTNQWLILELNDIEGITYNEIKNAIVMTFGDDVEYFIPIHHEEMGSYTSSSVLMEGYVFVKDCFKVRKYISNLREHRIFLKFLNQNGKYQTLDSHAIGVLKSKLKNSLKKKFIEGSSVKIKEGTFKNLIGEVVNIEDGGKTVIVKIKRLSREMIAPIPSTLLEAV